MKKTTIKILCLMLLAITYSGFAQTLNQNASWPNTSWTLTGTYNSDPLALESDPTISANFAFDDDDAGNGSDDDIAAESPVIDLTAAHTAGETWISISGNLVYNYNNDDILQFEYWDADASTWTIIGLPINADTASPPTDNFCSGTAEAYTSEVLNIAGFTATQLSGFRYRIYFDDLVGGAGYEWGFCFDSPTITSATPPTCPDPSSLMASNMTDTTVDLSWVDSGSATNGDIEIIRAGLTPTGTATATNVSNPYTATGLTENTEYDFYVRANCGVDGTSTWVGPFTFRTLCVAIAAPYTENFETFTTAGTAFVYENCWSATGGSYYWESAPGTDTGSGGTGPNPSITTGNYFYVEASAGVTGDITDLVSPLVDLSALTAPALMFNYHMFGGQIGTLEILVNGSTSIWSLSGQQQTSDTAPWELAIVDLAAYAGQSVSITFRATSVGTFEGDIAIDNAIFGELPSCSVPNALTATNIDGFSADIGWTENGTATSWNIELVDITAAGNATGNATETGVTNPHALSGLVPSNDYEFYVQADCGVDGTSSWAGPFSFTTTVACPEPTAYTATNITTTTADLGWTEAGSATLYDIEILRNGLTATGTATATGVANPYPATGLTEDTLYDFYVRADCGGNGTSAWAGPFTFRTACSAIAATYIEDFESFTTGGSAFEAENCWSATGGSYYWESAPGTDTGSGGTGPAPSITTGNYFYVEASAGVTGDITDLTSPLVDLTSLTNPALLFNYHMFGAQIGTLDVLVNGTTNVWSLSGQQQTAETTPWETAVIDLAAYAGQTISITFRATSVGTFEGDIAIDNVSFTELPACPIPNALTATTVTDVTAELGWTENGTSTSWDIEIVDITAAGTPTGTPTMSGVTNPYTAMGLTENNDYTFYVRSDCGASTYSTWAGPFAFTTLETCPAPSALTTNVTTNSADLGWTENGTSTSWNIELVDISAGATATGTATATGVTNPYTVSGLVADNTYEYYVQTDCGVDGNSAWIGPLAFTTVYVAVPPTCTSGNFLDSGGTSSDYSSNESTTYTIMPDVAGDAVTVEFTAFSTENNGTTACYDGLTVYDGPDATATTIDPPGGGTIWCWDENDLPAVGTGDLEGMVITSTHPSGALTFVFASDGSLTREGWEAIITCNPLSTQDFDNGLAFTYFPNPVNDNLVIKSQKDIENVTVYNMLGQEVLRTAPNTVNADINMSSLQNGAYFVKVTIGNATEMIRVIKN
ncbi:T9SS type A sorting domain-containing protein [Oceanihabitans sp. 2_MG-2023]|uniref:fibronectin type III domain-containing protein n=1 Tax=Oceanihabitans sp. 2_MG-2023 TaxID=3062661 RepID=UPI0026E18345|nr:T9SS type A sorting domain-containing protein [Oceanihabitans sp. 2_MG-2023]MDO6597339.1 T9SS type A sorting domain-containing protein [Oceanihabitans sp. 2_MG-2023]